MSISVSIVIPYRLSSNKALLWTQVRVSSDELCGLREFPGGKVDPGETPLMAALREVREETGVMIEDCELFKTYNFKEDLNLNVYMYNDKDILFSREEYKDIGELSSNLDQIMPNNQIILHDLYQHFKK
ncbi:MAG: NUDIX domain-containing protein [Halobacteriovoraceae bacterium]|jgi:mutator protein MutT|nr:NUDIX domain-containing protein [Halobacteriovoraceae bacterium]